MKNYVVLQGDMKIIAGNCLTSHWDFLCTHHGFAYAELTYK